MSRKHPYEPNYSGYAFLDGGEPSSKRDEFGLYYKKHRESGPRPRKKTYLTLLTGTFKVKYEDGSVEEFIINDSDTAIREKNEISSDSPLAVGAHKHKPGDYYDIPGGKVLLIEKDLDWLGMPHSKRYNPYKNVKWSYVNSNNTQLKEKREDRFFELYLKTQQEIENTKKKEEKNAENQEQVKQEKVEKKEKNILNIPVEKNDIEEERIKELEKSGLIPKIENSNETDTMDNYTKWKANEENKLKEKNYDIKTIFGGILLIVLIVSIVALIYIVFTGGYRGENDCTTAFQCTDHQISDSTVSWSVLILLTIPYVGFLTTICMIPAFGITPLILRSIIVLISSQKTRERIVKVLDLIFK